MTREEQLDWLYRLRSEIYVYMPKEWIIPMNNALDMTIKALEQEPCEDCVSREEAIDACNQSVNILEATDRIKDLPPVTSQELFMNKPCVAHQVCHEDKVKILDKIRAEIERQEKWLLQASYNAYNVDIAFDSIKSVLAESGDKE